MATILKKLFSHKKKTSTVSKKDSIGQIMETEQQLMKKQEALEKQIQEQDALARTHASTNKRLAIQALKRKKNLEKQQQHIDGVLQTLENQKTSLENASLHANILDVLATTSKTAKIANKNMDVDKVHDIMEDISEQYDIGQQISGAISNPLHCDYDESDLMAELNDLSEESIAATSFRSHVVSSDNSNDKFLAQPSEIKMKNKKLIVQVA